ncbi:hypothetical protein [Sphingomonas sp. SORGH_AS_0879]|nr:hypothetical protein [Sphingomonas sp. SORGH_AS_0879]MDQ1230071.1 hypothetical protein [Sphingomonas sp. SORGH_AS_0879]
MTAKPTTKTPPVQKAEAEQPETPVRVRPKLSLHYGARTTEERK